MNCADARERFAEMLEEGAQAAPNLPSHLAGCPTCASEFALLKSAVGELAALQVVPAPDGFADTVMARLGTVAVPGLAAKWLASWKSAALGVAGAAALATGLMLPSSPASREGDPLPAAERQMPGGQTPAGLAPAPRAAGVDGRAEAAQVTDEPTVATATAAETASTAAVTAAGTAAGTAGTTEPGTAEAGSVQATAPATATPPRRGPGLSGPHTEELAHPRDGRPVDPAAGDSSLDRPLAGDND
jgi:hypothetical protein